MFAPTSVGAGLEQSSTEYKLEVAKAMRFCRYCVKQDENERAKCTFKRSVKEAKEIIVRDVTQDSNYIDISKITKKLKQHFRCKKGYVSKDLFQQWLAERVLPMIHPKQDAEDYPNE